MTIIPVVIHSSRNSALGRKKETDDIVGGRKNQSSKTIAKKREGGSDVRRPLFIKAPPLVA